MTAATEAPAPGAVREYGVRVWQAGEPDQILPCRDLSDAEATLQEPTNGGTPIPIEIVSRPHHDWETDPAGLTADVRATAEQYVDHVVGDRTVRDRLARWLPGLDIDLVLSWPWERLVANVAWLRAAEDGPVSRHVDRDVLVREREELVAAAVRRVIGGGR